MAAWVPTHADERTPTLADKFASQTFELKILSESGISGKVSTVEIWVSIFVPSSAPADVNNVHVFFGPGYAADAGGEVPAEAGLTSTDRGLNAVMTHGFRGAFDGTKWIIIGVPGKAPDEDEAFHTIDRKGIERCLSVAGRRSTAISSLRFSAHSRGYRGLRETLNKRLISAPVGQQAVIFDAAYGSIDAALTRSRVPQTGMIAYNLVGTRRLTANGARNVFLPAGAMRAIGYSRIIQDAMVTNPSLAIPANIKGRLLPLPPRNTFTTKSPAPPGMTYIIDYSNTNRQAITHIVSNEAKPDGLMTFIDANNLIFLGQKFTADIYSHHLFVAELTHELTQ